MAGVDRETMQRNQKTRKSKSAGVYMAGDTWQEVTESGSGLLDSFKYEFA